MQITREKVEAALRPFDERIAAFEPMSDRTRRNLVRALAQVDPVARAAFLERHRAKFTDPSKARWLKYADFVYWARRNVLHAERLGLDTSEPLDVLDIGTGPGSFAMVASSMGHRTLGTDVRDQWNGEYCRICGVDLVIAPVQRGKPYRPVDRRFDLIAMMAPNLHRSVIDGELRYWSVADWEFLLTDLSANLLTEEGRIFIFMPPDRFGGEMSEPPLVEWARARGEVEPNPLGFSGEWGEAQATRIVLNRHAFTS